MKYKYLKKNLLNYPILLGSTRVHLHYVLNIMNLWKKLFFQFSFAFDDDGGGGRSVEEDDMTLL